MLSVMAGIAWLGAALLTALTADGFVQLLTVALIVVAAFPVLRSRVKDSTIETQAKSIEAKNERIKDLEADLRGCRERAEGEHNARLAAEKHAAKLAGQLEEAQKYTAREALETVTTHLGKIEALLQTVVARWGSET